MNDEALHYPPVIFKSQSVSPEPLVIAVTPPRHLDHRTELESRSGVDRDAKAFDYAVWRCDE